MGISSGGYRIEQYKRWASLRRETGFRSRFEAEINASLPQGAARYEAAHIPYKVTVLRHYTPDWLLPAQAIVLEAKGRFTKADRDKMLLVKTQYPDLDIRLVFMSLTAKVARSMSAADWCKEHGFLCCKGPSLPAAWLEHRPGPRQQAAFAAFVLEQ